MMGCIVCDRETQENSVYCKHHQAAYSNLEESYSQWRRALGLSWTEYLEKVEKVSGTGVWVKEVIKGILSGG